MENRKANQAIVEALGRIAAQKNATNAQAGDSRDGVIACRQIAEVLVHSLTSDEAVRKTFELVAGKGPAPADLNVLFAKLDADPQGALDGVRDMGNMPLEDEPQHVRDDLKAVLARRSGATR